MGGGGGARLSKKFLQRIQISMGGEGAGVSDFYYYESKFNKRAMMALVRSPGYVNQEYSS